MLSTHVIPQLGPQDKRVIDTESTLCYWANRKLHNVRGQNDSSLTTKLLKLECTYWRIAAWPVMQGMGPVAIEQHRTVLRAFGLADSYTYNSRTTRPHIVLGQWSHGPFKVTVSMMHPTIATATVNTTSDHYETVSMILGDMKLLQKSSSGKCMTKIDTKELGLGRINIMGLLSIAVLDRLRFYYPDVEYSIIFNNWSYTRLVFHVRIGLRILACTVSPVALNILCSKMESLGISAVSLQSNLRIYVNGREEGGTVLKMDNQGSVSLTGSHDKVEELYRSLLLGIEAVMADPMIFEHFVHNLTVLRDATSTSATY